MTFNNVFKISKVKEFFKFLDEPFNGREYYKIINDNIKYNLSTFFHALINFSGAPIK